MFADRWQGPWHPVQSAGQRKRAGPRPRAAAASATPAVNHPHPGKNAASLARSVPGLSKGGAIGQAHHEQQLAGADGTRVPGASCRTFFHGGNSSVTGCQTQPTAGTHCTRLPSHGSRAGAASQDRSHCHRGVELLSFYFFPAGIQSQRGRLFFFAPQLPRTLPPTRCSGPEVQCCGTVRNPPRSGGNSA
eukprot:gene19176-biopygen19028